MEILLSDADKRLVKWTIYLLRKKLGEQSSRQAIHDDMQNCANLGVREISAIVNNAADKVKCPYQSAVVKDLTELGLWICYKDTAYRDVFFYLLNDILNNADEIKEMIKPYVKPPEKWHVNIWIDSKNMTAKQIAEGSIPRGTVSEAESVHVPTIQKQRLDNIAKNSRR